ncbi:hypothetical protein [Halobacteriovorax marinus]|uniref:hypothetical protein n=1 Tax=Halobacteriovorax marinus TaxID=97084 RepID=UPI0012FD74AA|nr:hypothetical protein [Halobacteriovorax marinus]
MKKSNLLFISILFLAQSKLFAVELRQYCFPRNTSLTEVKKYLNQIKLDGDIININNSLHCLTVGVEEKRVGLFQKFLSMNYKFTTRGDNTISKNECQFEVETLRSGNKKTRGLKVGSRNDVRDRDSSYSGKSTSSIRVVEGKLAQLFVNDTLIAISCSVRGRVTEVNINLGTKKTNLVTTIQIRKGQRVDLGSVVQDLSNKNSEVSLSKGIQYSKTTGEKRDQVYLILK